MGALVMGMVIGIMVAVVVYLVGVMVRSIRAGKASRGLGQAWSNFSLSIVLCILFFLTWAGQGATQWQEYTDDQRQHHESVQVGDFVAQFSQSTLENWQSEFLQLFSFVVLSSILLHVGSAESKDSDDRVEEALARIERKLGNAEHSEERGG